MDNDLIHNLDQKPETDGFSYGKFFIFVGIAVILGTALGFGLTKLPKKEGSTNISSTKSEKTVGIADKKTFKDKAEGTLKEGGIDGEGSFHLVRPGGESQNVYLTSTTVDLSQYIGKKVRVWGETFAAEKAGWLMDVGLVEILK
ncbi:MAG: hypothetical protein V1803_01855 [Candidatus Roizmanbacteria bacterium]